MGWLILTMGFYFVAFGVGAEVRFDSPRIWERARALSVGQKVLSLNTSYQKYDRRFSSDGQLELLGESYSRRLSWGEILEKESSAGQLDMRDYMKRKGVADSDTAATSRYQVSRQETRFDIHWAYGLTDRWMIGFQIPVTLRNTRVTQEIEMAPDFVEGVSAARLKRPGQPDPRAMAAKVRKLAEQQLENSGYDRVPSEQQSWDWGDVTLMSQETLMRSYSWAWGFQQIIRVPTSRNQSVSDYIQSSTDSGQIDLGVASLVDYRHRKWLLGWGLGYVFQLPDSVRLREPTEDSQLSQRVAPATRRDLGDWLWSSADANWSVARTISLNVRHSLLTKQRDTYSGRSPEGLAYNTYGTDTDQQLQETRLGLLYRLGSSSSRGGILSRWIAGIDYTYPWVGKNSMEASRTSLELMSYF